MILWKSKGESEKEIFIKSMGLRTWRWQLEINERNIGLFEHMKYEARGDQWSPAVRYYSIGFNKKFRFGYDEFQYDGMHASFSLGFIHLYWFSDK